MVDNISFDAFPHKTFDKVRYGDTDRQGHVNNAVFATFLETGRAELLYDPEAPLADRNCVFVIVRLSLDFVGELTWPGRVDIGTRVAAIGRSSMTFQQALFEADRLAAKAETVIVQMNETTRRAQSLSETVRNRLHGLVMDPVEETTQQPKLR